MFPFRDGVLRRLIESTTQADIELSTIEALHGTRLNRYDAPSRA